MSWLGELGLDSRLALPSDHRFIFDSWLRSYEETFWRSAELAHYPGHAAMLLRGSAEYRQDVQRGIAPVAAKQKQRAMRAFYLRTHTRLIDALLPNCRVLFHVQQPDEIVAWVCGLGPRPGEEVNRLHYLFVKQLFRGQGIGARLLRPTLVYSHRTPALRGMLSGSWAAAAGLSSARYVPEMLLVDADVGQAAANG